MEIIVKAPLMADKIKELLDGGEFDGISFRYKEKKGMEMTFTVSGENAESSDAAAIAKSAIRSTSYGKGIYFSVVKK